VDFNLRNHDQRMTEAVHEKMLQLKLALENAAKKIEKMK
jgi:hypothetical protein